MTVNNFGLLITRGEGRKKQVNIAQTLDLLKAGNIVSGGLLYKMIRSLKG